MTNAELISKIKAEIERRVDILATVSVKQAKDGDSEMSTYYHGKAVSLEELIPFLSTLESEKPIIPVELERAVVDYFEGYWPGMETAEQCNTDLHFTPPAIMRLARHFAQWGAEHLKQ